MRATTKFDYIHELKQLLLNYGKSVRARVHASYTDTKMSIELLFKTVLFVRTLISRTNENNNNFSSEEFHKIVCKFQIKIFQVLKISLAFN